MATKQLNTKQLTFIDEYIISGNASDAARKAGFADPANYAQQLMLKPQVKDEIERRRVEIQEKSLVTKLELINSLKEILDNTMETSPRTAIQAIEVLNKMLGFNAMEKTEHTFKVEQPLFGELPDGTEDIDYIEE